MGSEEYKILKVTQETTTLEAIQQALKKANLSDERPEDYVIVEEVNKSWEKQDTEQGGGEQRILDKEENILTAQNRWKGSGKFMLRKKGNDPSTRAWMTTLVKEQKRRETSTSSDVSSPDWDSHHNIFLVCVHNVSEDQPYTILKAPVSSTAQDIITQAILKARRKEDPRTFVLVEEVTFVSSHDNKRQLGHSERRIVGDEEKVYIVQHQWKSNAAKLVLTERDKAVEELGKKAKPGERKNPIQRLGEKLGKLNRERRDRSRIRQDAERTSPKNSTDTIQSDPKVKINMAGENVT